MNILVTLDSNYVYPLKVMLTSLFMNNEGEVFDIYVMNASLKNYELDDLKQLIEKNNSKMINVRVDEKSFDRAPTLRHYTKAMYYRLLAHEFLPEHLDKILYLDPDILVLNKVNDLYNMDFENNLFLMAYHAKIASKSFSQARLRPFKIKKYYNSGVILMNLNLIRKKVRKEDIYDYVNKYGSKLMLPDQDIINALYADSIKTIDEILYNYDARSYSYYKTYYKLKSKRLCDMDYVIKNTVIMHFCGKKKPWNADYPARFVAIYKNYEKNLIEEK